MNKLFGNILLFVVLAIAGLYLLSLMTPSHNQPAQAQMRTSSSTSSSSASNNADASYSIIAQPRLSPDFINQVLKSYGSPAQGKGQVLYDLGQKYHINSDLALAFFGHESTFGTSGEAISSKSLGNLRCLGSDYADLNTWCQDGYAWFDTWEHGFEAFYRLLRNLYVDTWNLKTLPDIIHKYAPAADNNNESGYVQELVAFLSAWYSGKVRP